MRYEITSTKTSNVDKIHVRFAHWGWVDFYLEDMKPGVGQLVINSDWGCWAYGWGAMGDTHTLASFILQADNSYIIHKLMLGQKTTRFDAERTIVKWKREIMRERHLQDLSADKARELWDELVQWSKWDMPDDEVMFIEHLPTCIEEWLGHEPWEHTEHELNSTYCNLDEVIMPALRCVLQARQERACQATR